MKLVRGTVLLIELDPTVGREQRGVRPCIVVSDPDVISDQRFPLLCVLPVTGTPGEGLLYPSLAAGPSGLAKKSYALIDHPRSVDERRVRSVFGALAAQEIAAIDEGLAAFLGLRDRDFKADIARRVTPFTPDPSNSREKFPHTGILPR